MASPEVDQKPAWFREGMRCFEEGSSQLDLSEVQHGQVQELVFRVLEKVEGFLVSTATGGDNEVPSLLKVEAEEAESQPDFQGGFELLTDDLLESSTVDVLPRRRRGRPRKYPVVAEPKVEVKVEASSNNGHRRRPGRPRKKPLVQDVQEEKAPARKRRGRPRKRPLSPDPEEAEMAEQPEVAESEVAESEVAESEVANSPEQQTVPEADIPKMSDGTLIISAETFPTIFGKTGRPRKGEVRPPKDPRACPICGVVYRGVKRHMARVHGPKKTCPQCAQEVPVLSFRQHMRCHEEPTSLQCPHCDRVCTTQTRLRNHLYMQHQAQNRVVCDICGKSVNKYVMEQHMDGHKGGQYMHGGNHICAQCGKAFLTEHRLKRHQNVHRPADRVCAICGVGFRKPMALKEHEAEHRGETLHSCKICNAGFYKIKALRKHEANVHEIGKKHHCPYCPRSFYSKSSFQDHIGSHTGVKRHVCKICGSAYFFHGSLSMHIRTEHKSPSVADISSKPSLTTTV
ncbi:unnamed protein product [Cyprideis torosa]|uniref:Uncharacterized protein n=1 Tax=Cyprideis torosa TaxID=163714 RepID=A0A7R8W7C3_9CRUS|nr:unnamed protein product [Cyprideis torosa]CAG0887420.1 unnamed protein product [Cyprideis torosa]